ncbi:MAG: exodeoxyribonuclease VII large subunit, partial [Coriobacteriaceae bacterium]|nr:exodeoxyribonuclease VII large subunit [Coriobacteriaceae bacterium]
MAETRRETAPISVSQASALAKNTLKGLGTLCVIGEVSGFRGPARGGHCYFEVKDAESALSAIIWKGVYQSLGFVLEDGQQLVMYGDFDVYKASGKLSFVIRYAELAGEGMLRQQVAQLERKLAAEGLMDDARKLRVPEFCERIAVCTSFSGKVLHDVEMTLARRNPLVVIERVECSVQGKEAPPTIIQALRTAEAMRPDAILLVRGGGSFEELMCFNDEGVARAIAACTVPIVTGIGHEPDTTIADKVADKRAS